MSSIRWRMKAWNRPWLWLVFCGRHLSCWPFYFWTENKKCLLLAFFGGQSQPKCTIPNRRLGHNCHSQWKDLWEACWRWGRREVWTNFNFLFFWRLTRKYIFSSSESSQLWVGPRTLSSAELAWWPGIPMDRFWFKQFVLIFQIFSCIFFPYQVERTTFFEGTDVEFAQLSEQVICMLVAIVFAL